VFVSVLIFDVIEPTTLTWSSTWSVGR